MTVTLEDSQVDEIVESSVLSLFGILGVRFLLLNGKTYAIIFTGVSLFIQDLSFWYSGKIPSNEMISSTTPYNYHERPCCYCHDCSWCGYLQRSLSIFFFPQSHSFLLQIPTNIGKPEHGALQGDTVWQQHCKQDSFPRLKK